MIVLDAGIGSELDIRETLSREGDDTLILVPGDFDVTVGSLVLLRIALRSTPAGIFLEGVVQARHVPMRKNRNAHAIQVRLLPSQRSRVDFLELWSAGKSRSLARSEWRYPVDHKILFSSAKRGVSGRMIHATLRDVSRHGALAVTTTQLSVDQFFSFGFLDPKVTRAAFQVRVAWSNPTLSGLVLQLASADETNGWNAIVDTAEQDLRKRIVRPRSPSIIP